MKSAGYGDWKRDFRWNIKLKPSLTLKHDPSNPKSGTTSLSADFTLSSDPYFVSEFDNKRTKVIELEKIFRQEEVSFFNTPGLSARNWSFAISDKRGGSSLSLNGNWAYNAYRNSGQKNIYANDYYKYKKRSIILPTVSYSFSGKILSSAPAADRCHQYQQQHDQRLRGGDQSRSGFRDEQSGKKGPPDILDTSDDLAGAKAKQKISYSLGYSAGINFTVTKLYTEEGDLDQKQYKRGLNLKIPASFSIGSDFSSSLNLSLNDTDQWGETTTTNQIQANDKATKTTFSESASVKLGHIFNKGLLSEIGGSLSLSTLFLRGFRTSRFPGIPTTPSPRTRYPPARL